MLSVEDGVAPYEGVALAAAASLSSVKSDSKRTSQYGYH